MWAGWARRVSRCRPPPSCDRVPRRRVARRARPRRRSRRGTRRGGQQARDHPAPGLIVADSIAAALVAGRGCWCVDNCEHVLDAAADLVEMILDSVRRPSLLATAGKDCGRRDEHLWSVPSSIGRRRDSAAATLFVERARAVAPGLRVDRRRHASGRRRDLPPPRRDPAGDRVGGVTAAVDDGHRSPRSAQRPVPAARRVAARTRDATRRCAMPSNGPMTCSMMPKRPCWHGVRCSQGGSTWRALSAVGGPVR